MAEDDENYVQEEEVTNIPGWVPSISWQENDEFIAAFYFIRKAANDMFATGEEGEDEIYSQTSQLYHRFNDGEWKERGLGQAKLLKNKESGKIRFVLRQEKPEKVVANHYVLDYNPHPSAGSEKCWVWTGRECEEHEQVVELFALKFGSQELAQAFKVAFDEAKTQNAQVGLAQDELQVQESEDEMYSQRSLLYHFKDGEWKERGLGQAKLLKNKESGKIRFVLRQEQTEKVVACHYVLDYNPYCDLQPNAGSEKCWVWIAPDCAGNEQVVELFALKFGSEELAQAFKEAFDDAKAKNAQVGLSKDELERQMLSEVVAPAGVESTTKTAAQTPDPAPPEAAPHYQ
eukprot:TRINITY_DN15459_c0_g2_i1.p1 TRINITY_DN15459_c0_g2~~TRINITY_DN15459_c0_g2_i1.p1  ORF type:complete len:345 (-),score=96.32 TRINITY_DN15459_c0_g2_i1:33-1067(-)